MAQFSRTVTNNLTYKIIAAAIEVHRHLGPGLLESVYQRCMEQELQERSLSLRTRCTLPVVYKGTKVGGAFQIDILVENLVIMELKSVEELAPVHEAQVLTYLKLSGTPIGLLINFNVPILKDGVRRVLNKQHELIDEFSPWHAGR